MNFIDILYFKWWVSQFHFVAAEKNEFAVGVKILLLGKNHQNLFNIAQLTPDCLFYELKIICHDFSICCYDIFHPFSFLTHFDHWR